MKNVLETEFVLAIKLNVDTWTLNFKDFSEVKYLSNRYAKYVAELEQKRQLAGK